ncbi:MAG TPA: phosphatidylinositol-specific phospholipase C [Myxococcaceae bacterium]|nr:phosphatidylinositol-specific phospholipase C [Myxococcaceae bacterium]
MLNQSVDTGTNTNAFTITNKPLDPQNWMGRVADSKLLSQLTIPGTHDSTASWSVIPSACCQSLSTTDQLNLGIRFLDIRCKQEFNALLLMHGPIPEGGPVNGIFQECANFLQAHPKETILMSIKNEGSDDEAFDAALRTAMSAFPSLFYVNDELPTLGAARKKVVFLRRVNVSAAGPWGLALATGWQDNTTFDIQYKSSNGQPQSFHVQDVYGTADVNFKWAQIKACLDMAAGTTEGGMFLNFCSATGSALQLTDPKTMANGITPLLQSYFATAKPLTRYGVVVMDFPNEAIVSEMINTNT